MRPKILNVEAIEHYKLNLQFADGTAGILDVGDCAGKGVFTTWEDDNNFFKVFIDSESGAITWPGDIDIDTYNAYCIIKCISPEAYFNQKQVYAPNL